MRFTKTLVGTFASLLLVTSCIDFGFDSSALSGDDKNGADGCTLTQGFWKNHPDAWPVSSLTLGTNTYTKEALLAILKLPVKGNGLIMLAHQLIAAKLNIAAGADDADIAATIAAADALIDDLEAGVDSLEPKDTSALNDTLDEFNRGEIGPGHCEDGPPSCDGDGKCDGGGGCDHDEDGDCDLEDEGDDGCDHDDCDHDGDGDCDGKPHVPACGDGHIDAGETCDDGNTTPHDGCSATCELELPD